MSFILRLIPLSEFWFAGLLVVIYWFLQKIIGLSGEQHEWTTWLIGFLIFMLLFILKITEKFKPNILLKIIISIPFYIVLVYICEFTYGSILFLFGSVVLCLGETSFSIYCENQIDRFVKILLYFIIFHIGSKILFWNEFTDIIWLKVNETSKYYEYSQIIEMVTPALVHIIFFSSLLIFMFSVKKDFTWKPLMRYWWIIPGILFFFEAFNTTGFFGKIGGGAFLHWQPLIGPIEMMQQGGYLLWDIPSQYGFLRMIAIYLVPVQDAWQKTYLLNGIMQLAYSLLIFKVIWQKRGLIWYVISIAFTLALVFFMTAHPPTMLNSNSVPTGGAMRFFWLVLMMYVIVTIRHRDLKNQFFVILPIWIAGFLWAIESAVYVTVVLGSFALYHLIYGNNKLKERIKILLLFPLSLLIVVLLISLFYLWRLGNLPDYWTFFEFVFYAKGGSYFAEPINIFGPIWVPICMLSLMLSQVYEYKDKYSLFCALAVMSVIWVIFPYWVAHSMDVVIFKLMVPTIFGFFLLLTLMDEKHRIKQLYLFSPILIMTLVMIFGTPQTARHIYNTVTNQDYTLSNTIDEEVDDMHHIFSMITPEDVPVSYVDPGRYMFLQKNKKYRDINTNEFVPLNNKIWLPIYPANLFWEYMPEKRKIEYINRWLFRHPVNTGWVINANENAYGHWMNKNYENALNKALSGKFQIKKRVEYGDLKAILYEKKI